MATPSAMKDDVALYKRELILRAAGELFFRNGYTATTTDALTERLSVSKTLIYQHFRSKQDMLATICERGISESVQVAIDAAALPGRADERLFRLLHDFTLVVIERHEWIAISSREVAHLPADVDQRIRDMQGDFDRIVRDIIKDGLREGVFDVEDPAIVCLGIAGMIIWIHAWYRGSGRLTPEQIADSMARSALRMVGAPDRPALETALSDRSSTGKLD
ncbi:TetR/AcrR family transcriptional regulator [Camelimonas lactis]|uniref:TetR family transcriptional regulator n=1 Tax=Camelimonas lactis TaxID=659006 RepID=A0A4R2GQM2_9HYPH|nr:TetR/AcrR family transcriptional regulator [Camelimonas lactis]TCO12062.1 TetR family transcriptional regulator [Camelimonas lactis]